MDEPVDPPVDGADIEPELEPVLLPPELLGWLPEPQEQGQYLGGGASNIRALDPHRVASGP